MANKNITMKQYNGTDYDVLYPATTVEQVTGAQPAATAITTSNIGSQSVNYANTAGSAPASDVYSWAKASAKPSYSASEVGAVPTSRTVNSKALSSNITLSASDVGAAASSHNQAASTITAGTFAGQVVANSSGETYSTYCLRNQRLASSDTNPTVNGEICWTYS